MAYIDLADIVMADTVMVDIVLAKKNMAYIVMAWHALPVGRRHAPLGHLEVNPHVPHLQR